LPFEWSGTVAWSIIAVTTANPATIEFILIARQVTALRALVAGQIVRPLWQRALLAVLAGIPFARMGRRRPQADGRDRQNDSHHDPPPSNCSRRILARCMSCSLLCLRSGGNGRSARAGRSAGNRKSAGGGVAPHGRRHGQVRPPRLGFTGRNG